MREAVLGTAGTAAGAGLPPHPSWPSCLCGIAMAGHKCSKLCAAVIVSGNDTMHQHMAVQTS